MADVWVVSSFAPSRYETLSAVCVCCQMLNGATLSAKIWEQQTQHLSEEDLATLKHDSLKQ
jgi:hypothetical protein